MVTVVNDGSDTVTVAVRVVAGGQDQAIGAIGSRPRKTNGWAGRPFARGTRLKTSARIGVGFAADPFST